MANKNWEAKRENRQLGHVAIHTNPYRPNTRLPPEAIARDPWMCVFHDEIGGPKAFIAFGGLPGMNAALEATLGPIL